MNKIICLGSNTYKDWIGEALLDKFEESGLIIFTGGPDVDPVLYGEENKHSYVSKDRTRNDVKNYKEALENNIPMLGICYGSQFGTAMQPNGKVIQDVSNHALYDTHSIIDMLGDEYQITSTHHQMMYPFDIEDKEIIAWSSVKRSTHYLTGFGEYSEGEISLEPEIVYYPKSNFLAIQGHPEFDRCPERTKEYCKNLIEKYLLKK